MPPSILRSYLCASLLAVGVATLGGASAVRAAESLSPDRFVVAVSGQRLEIPIESSRPLDAFDASVERIVVVVHGSAQNSGACLRRLLAAAEMAPGEAERTLAVAPQFLEEADIERWRLPRSMLFWSDGWREGNKSLDTRDNPRPARISSYAVVDRILDALIDPALFPNLAEVVIVGHSAGGQFTQRYAAGTAAVERHASTAFRFVVANPSSYLYLSPERPVPGAPATFAKPPSAARASCPDWNDYKYGLQRPNAYMAEGGSAIVARYARREVRYLLGGEDTGSAELDTSCAAELMGANRLERGTIYFSYLQHFYGPSIPDQHRLAVVPGVGHSFEQVFQSDEGIEALFGETAPPQPRAPRVAPFDVFPY